MLGAANIACGTHLLNIKRKNMALSFLSKHNYEN